MRKIAVPVPHPDTLQLRTLFDACRTKSKLSQSDWYLHPPQKILDDKTFKILKKEFNGSMYNALSLIFPEIDWHPWKFKHQNVPEGYWKEISNQRKFFDDLAIQVGVNSLQDWHNKISNKLLLEHGGGTILSMHNWSSIEALRACYPEYNWLPWMFSTTSHGFWKSVDNQRQFFDWLAKKLGLEHLDGWYNAANQKVVRNHGGSTVLTLHNGSAVEALLDCYPEHNWIPWKFKTVRKGFWKSVDNQKKFFDWLGNQLGVKTLDDWYSVLDTKTLLDNGGSRILFLYGSAIEALRTIYPEHNWFPWKFQKTLRSSWDSKENISQFLSGVSEKLCIQTLDDWYRVDVLQLQQVGASSLVKKYRGLYSILKQQYPDHPWDPKRFTLKKKGQRWLMVTLKKVFPNEGTLHPSVSLIRKTEILEDYLHPKAVSASNRPLQLDVFIPSKSIAFEYQGQQHYHDVKVFQPQRIYQKRDEEKKVLCAQNNIKLIEVPYWWNRTQESLQKMLNHQTMDDKVN